MRKFGYADDKVVHSFLSRPTSANVIHALARQYGIPESWVSGWWSDLCTEIVGVPDEFLSAPDGDVLDVISDVSSRLPARAAWTLLMLPSRVAQQHLIRTLPNIVPLAPAGTHRDSYVYGSDGRPAELYYASYGSNLFADRFHTYLQGGPLAGTDRVYEGALNPNAPTDDIPVALNGTVFYAGHSSVWRSGVAFLDTSTHAKSLGRAYKITAEQFDDVVAQENREPVGSVHTDTRAAITRGRLTGPGVYDTLVHVGDYDGCPVFTFTGPFTTRHARQRRYTATSDGLRLLPRPPLPLPYEHNPSIPGWPIPLNPPSEQYRSMLSDGLHETHNLTREQTSTYFAGASQ